MALEPNRKLFPDHLPSILRAVLVGAGLMWPTSANKCFYTYNFRNQFLVSFSSTRLGTR
jgi:hypothetical protein